MAGRQWLPWPVSEKPEKGIWKAAAAATALLTVVVTAAAGVSTYISTQAQLELEHSKQQAQQRLADRRHTHQIRMDYVRRVADDRMSLRSRERLLELIVEAYEDPALGTWARRELASVRGQITATKTRLRQARAALVDARAEAAGARRAAAEEGQAASAARRRLRAAEARTLDLERQAQAQRERLAGELGSERQAVREACAALNATVESICRDVRRVCPGPPGASRTSEALGRARCFLASSQCELARRRVPPRCR